LSNPKIPTGAMKMKSKVLSLVIAVALVMAVTLAIGPTGISSGKPFASPLAPGNVVVYRVGTGAAALANTGTAVFLDEYNSAGTLVQTIPMPTTASGSQLALLASGTAGSEGLLTLSEDRNYLVVPGYNGTLGSAVLVAANLVNRVIGRVDASGVVDTSTGISSATYTGNTRSAATDDGSQFWVTGSASGLVYVPFGSVTASPTTLYNTVANLRQVKTGKGQLYLSTASGTTFRLGTVGTGLPTTAGQTVASLPGLPTGALSPYSYALFDLDGTPGYDTLYMTENTGTGGINKYSLVAGSWITNGLISLASPAGLTGINNGSTVTLYATTAITLAQAIDTAGYNAAPSTTTPTTLATAGTNQAFRGVAFAPGTNTPNAITLNTFSGSTPANNGWIIVILLAAVALLAGGWALHRRTQA
jgi:hypothetical protein